MAENEDLKQEAQEAVDHLRKTADKYDKDSAEFKTALDATEKKLEKYEEVNQKLTGDIAQSAKDATEAKERVELVEKKLLSLDGSKAKEGKSDYKNTPQYKALNGWAQGGMDAIDPEQKQLLRGDISTEGGYLTMPEMDDMIIKKITEISPVRQFSRVKNVGSKTLLIPTRTSIPMAYYEGEAEEGQKSTSGYGSESLTTYALQTTVPFTRDILMDSRFDLESEINQDVSEAFAFGEGRNFLLGDGAKKPEGILTSTNLIAAYNATTNPVGYRTSETTAEISFDDLRLMTGDLKVGYNPVYFFNRLVKANMLVQKASDGQYLWAIGRENAPAMLNGYPYALFEDMPNIATDAFSVGFGDLARGYCITDFTGMEVVRDDLTRVKERIIELTFFRWNTGQVVLEEAIKLLKVK